MLMLIADAFAIEWTRTVATGFGFLATAAITNILSIPWALDNARTPAYPEVALGLLFLGMTPNIYDFGWRLCAINFVINGALQITNAIWKYSDWLKTNTYWFYFWLILMSVGSTDLVLMILKKKKMFCYK